MMKKDLQFYIYAFQRLNRDGNKKRGNAPHQPILLLSVINLYENNLETDNRIYLTPDLIGFFRDNWNNLVETNHHPRITLPFFHLRNTKGNFWNLIPNAGCEVWIASKSAMRSFHNLKTAVAFAQIDAELHRLLQEKESRDVLKTLLLETYFSDVETVKKDFLAGSYSQNIINQILNDDDDFAYQKESETRKKIVNKEVLAEEKFTRSGYFKREVARIYKNTCCISKLKVDAHSGISMIDACHIMRFSLSKNDRITNGIALCPNLHRAFDRGLITINEHYEVVVSNIFKENNCSYSIRQFEGQKILLPDKQAYLPSQENLHWHRLNVFEKWI